MEIIQSKENSIIKETKKLKEKRFRVEKEQFLIEGFRFVEEALKSNFQVPMIFLSEEAMEKWKNYKMDDKLQQKTKLHVVKESILKLLSSTENPQGVVAVVDNKMNSLNIHEGFYVLVDKLQDPGNLGTIIRSAHAAAASGVILTKGTVDVYNEKTLRSTMGSIFNIPIIEDKDFSIIKSLKKNGFKVVVSSLDKSEDFYNIDLTGKIIIAVGNEGAGISDEVFSLGDIRAKIPMPGGAESLNAAAAASIMIFETVRQKLTSKK